MKKINVLIVDDSAYMRNIISNILSDDPAIGTIFTAHNGLDALDKMKKNMPDVVTLDLIMPKLNGIKTLDAIMSECPVPVVIISAFSKANSHETLEALNHGAVDFLQKPSGMVSLDMNTVSSTLIDKIKSASMVNVKKIKPRFIPPSPSKKKFRSAQKNFKKLVVIASSTGGPPALSVIFSMLPQELDACILIVQHMPAGFTHSFAGRLSNLGSLTVTEAQAEDTLAPHIAYVAPGGFHMEVTLTEENNRSQGRIELNKKEPIFGLRPAADITMSSVAEVFGKDVVGVVLTGMGSDGAEGLKKIKEHGGATIAQDEESSIIFGMPKAAIDEGVVGQIVPLEKIASEIVRLVNS